MTITFIHCPVCDTPQSTCEGEDSAQEKYCQSCKSFFDILDAPRMQGMDRWVANRIGDEVSIVHEQNFHGRISYGWFHPDRKILFAKLGPFESDNIQILRLAERRASEMNIGKS